MSIEELKNEGLSREYRIFIPIAGINSEVDAEIEEKAKTFKMPGFREGKVPLSLVKRQIGQDLLNKQMQKSIDETLRSLLEEKEVRPALPPEVAVEGFEQDKGLTFKVKFEVLPVIPQVKFEGIEVEVIEVDISDDDIKKSHNEILKRFGNLKESKADYAASIGDTVKIDFTGAIDGKEFNGGSKKGFELELGGGKFIPGFEEQLKRVKAGDKKTIDVEFPDDYPEVGGKKATFDVEVKAVLYTEGPKEVNEDFVKKVGFEDIKSFNEMLRKKLEADFSVISRFKTKKVLFDKLDEICDFDVPPSMLKSDFESIWKEAKEKIEKGQGGTDKPMEELEEDYRKVAKRRVKLGILLAELARLNDVKASEQDIQSVISMQIGQSPEKEKEIRDFYNNKDNLRRLEGPILEEKSVDFILSKIEKKVKKVSSAEFAKLHAAEGGI